MTSSHRETLDAKESELRLFWQMSNALGRLIRGEPVDLEIDEVYETFNTMAQMSDWPSMREACWRAAYRSEALQTKAKAGAA